MKLTSNMSWISLEKQKAPFGAGLFEKATKNRNQMLFILAFLRNLMQAENS